MAIKKYSKKMSKTNASYAKLRRKYLMDHPLIKHNASWRLRDLEDACEVIIGLFSDYVGPITH